MNGFEAYFEKATIQYEGATLAKAWTLHKSLVVITNDGKATAPKLKAGGEWYSAFTAELQAACDGIAKGEEPRLLSGTLARDALKLAHLETKSAATGKAVAVK